MADEQNQTTNQQPTNQQAEPPLNNDQNARNEDGSLKDVRQQQPPAETKVEPKAGAPDKYEFKSSVPDHEVDPKVVEAATPIFKELNLTNEQGQKLVDFFNDQVKAMVDHQYQQYETLRNGWRDTVAKDATLGNGTDNLKDSVKAEIGRVIDMLPNKDAFKSALDMTGAGDHPEMIRAMVFLASKITEGKPVTAGKPAEVRKPGEGQRTLATAMYPNLPA